MGLQIWREKEKMKIIFTIFLLSRSEAILEDLLRHLERLELDSLPGNDANVDKDANVDSDANFDNDANVDSDANVDNDAINDNYVGF
jgi:hypothetical protein